MKLKDRISLVTGAGRGIGKAIALEFALHGSMVFINDINEADAAGTCRQIEEGGGKCLAYKADVGDQQQVKEMFEFVHQKAGRLDILVNNAAILRDKTLHKMETKFHWDDVIKIDLTGVFYCCREAITGMRENNYGRIINMTSVIGICGNFGQTAYGAAKAGVIGFTKSLAHEAAPRGITVNAIAPGFIETEMIKDIPSEIKSQILSRIPVGKFGQVADISKLALFLASEDAGYITGQVIGVNGGFLMP